MKITLIIAAAFIAWVIYIGSKPMTTAEKSAYALDEAIKECWNEYDKKSNTDTEKQFLASACENLEARKK